MKNQVEYNFDWIKDLNNKAKRLKNALKQIKNGAPNIVEIVKKALEENK